MRHRIVLIAFLVSVVALAAACTDSSPQVPTVQPTKTPKPTFTATPQASPTPEVFPTATPLPATPTPDATATPEATPIPPTPTPLPNPRLTANSNINVRSGPGTVYSRIGTMAAGQSFDVTGKNPNGDWMQFNYNGQSGWVLGSLVSLSGDTGAILVAQNIPAAPPPTAVPPTAVPQPTATPRPQYEFIAHVQRCDRQPAGNWFEGTVYKNSSPVNGYRVVFSYAADGPWVTQPQTSGPHTGYPGWNTGYYSHIIHATNPQPGTWYVWLVNSDGGRISTIGSWTSTGPGEGCNQAVVDFDTH